MSMTAGTHTLRPLSTKLADKAGQPLSNNVIVRVALLVVAHCSILRRFLCLR